MLRSLLLKEHVIKDNMIEGMIESEVKNESSRPWNDTDVDDADVRPIYDEEPMAEEVNSCAMIQSNKSRNSNKPIDQKSHTQKPGRQIFTGHMFSPNKTSAVYEKTSPRSDLRFRLDVSLELGVHDLVFGCKVKKRGAVCFEPAVQKQKVAFCQCQ
nr:hypothetical protein [Tanacetum cinerariifolium]